MDDKTIFRRAKDRENPFVMIDKSVFEDTSISWKAKGIMGYLLSRPDDWTVRLRDIANRAADGIHSAKTGLRELEKAGYLTRHVLRNNGRFAGLLVLVHEIPVLEQDRTFQTNNPGVENPPAETPIAENLVTTNTDCYQEEICTNIPQTVQISELPSTENPFSISNTPGEPTNGRRDKMIPRKDYLEAMLEFADRQPENRPKGWQDVSDSVFAVCEHFARLWLAGRIPKGTWGDRAEKWQAGASELLDYHDGDILATKKTLDSYYQHFTDNGGYSVGGPQSILNGVAQFLAQGPSGNGQGARAAVAPDSSVGVYMASRETK